jgi:ankyrin repeat protein
LGADPNAVDSYGNTCLGRAILDAKQMIKHPFFEGQSSWSGEGLDDTGRDLALTQIRSVFQALIDAGADINSSNNRRKSAVDDVKISGLEAFELF